MQKRVVSSAENASNASIAGEAADIRRLTIARWIWHRWPCLRTCLLSFWYCLGCLGGFDEVVGLVEMDGVVKCCWPMDSCGMRKELKVQRKGSWWA